jgi:hypothetical protein
MGRRDRLPLSVPATRCDLLCGSTSCGYAPHRQSVRRDVQGGDGERAAILPRRRSRFRQATGRVAKQSSGHLAEAVLRRSRCALGGRPPGEPPSTSPCRTSASHSRGLRSRPSGTSGPAAISDDADRYLLGAECGHEIRGHPVVPFGQSRQRPHPRPAWPLWSESGRWGRRQRPRRAQPTPEASACVGVAVALGPRRGMWPKQSLGVRRQDHGSDHAVAGGG